MSQLIGEVEKNQSEKIRVSIEQFRNHTFVDLRVYWRDGDTLRPSKKGIALNDECLDEVITMLQQAGKAMEGR